MSENECVYSVCGLMRFLKLSLLSISLSFSARTHNSIRHTHTHTHTHTHLHNHTRTHFARRLRHGRLWDSNRQAPSSVRPSRAFRCAAHFGSRRGLPAPSRGRSSRDSEQSRLIHWGIRCSDPRVTGHWSPAKGSLMLLVCCCLLRVTAGVAHETRRCPLGPKRRPHAAGCRPPPVAWSVLSVTPFSYTRSQCRGRGHLGCPAPHEAREAARLLARLSPRKNCAPTSRIDPLLLG